MGALARGARDARRPPRRRTQNAKFRALAERMQEALPDARLRVVPGAGHAVQLEAPDAVADRRS